MNPHREPVAEDMRPARPGRYGVMAIPLAADHGAPEGLYVYAELVNGAWRADAHAST